ncbi:hypothetical protein PENTCL1PPCAC_8609, partial [Pristionchus entomophagus]
SKSETFARYCGSVDSAVIDQMTSRRKQDEFRGMQHTRTNFIDLLKMKVDGTRKIKSETISNEGHFHLGDFLNVTLQFYPKKRFKNEFTVRSSWPGRIRMCVRIE